MYKEYVWHLLLCIFVLAVFYTVLSFIAHDRIVYAFEELDAQRRKYYADATVTLEFPQGDEHLPMEGLINYTCEFTDAPFILVLFKIPSQKITVEWNDEAVTKAVSAIYREPIPSELQFTHEGGWQLSKEQNYRSFDIDSVVSKILNADLMEKVTIDVTRYMETADYNYDELKGQYDFLRRYNDFIVTYTDGTTLTGKDIFASFEDPFNPDFTTYDLSWIKDSLLSSYDTSGTILDFTTTGGEELRVPYVTFGKRLDWDREEKVLHDAILTGESLINRTPALLGYDSFSNSYVEVSIEDQHVWHYVDSELCCEPDCVTGTKNRHDTPTGVYYVSERIPGKYLTGEDYKTWVNQWMRLTNSGIGLHDAYWRNKFGGEIYMSNGSHGCINLPPTYAKNLFSELTNGYPVIIY